MTTDVVITMEKADNCYNDFCWCLFRSDKKNPVIGGLSEQQAINHKKIMKTLITSSSSSSINMVPSSIG